MRLTMRLIDLDQQVIVPIVDETQGGVEYEQQMTLAELFEKFLPDFKPWIMDAVPVEWLYEFDMYYAGISGGSPYMKALIEAWKGQEAR